MALLRLAARHGRWCLVLGLIVGVTVPSLALVLKAWLPPLVAFLLFLAAFRIGPSDALGSISAARTGLLSVVALQCLVPLIFLGLVTSLGVQDAPLALAVALALSAPALTGSPNLTILLGHEPAAAMRLALLGTALFPLTVLPILLVSPMLGDPVEVFLAAFRLLLVIAGAVGMAFVIRWILPRAPSSEQRADLDGASAIVLGIIAVGLMSAVGPTLENTQEKFFLWLTAAFAVCFGMQIATYRLGRQWIEPRNLVATSVVAGNRNIALFLLALPAEVTEPLLLFIGCWQFPMYLTPLLMRRFYQSGV